MKMRTNLSSRHAVLLTTLVLSACAGDPAESGSATEVTQATGALEESGAIEAFPGQTGTLNTGTFSVEQNGATSPTALTYLEIEGLKVYQGDIILGAVQETSHPGQDSCVMTSLGSRWPNGIVYFEYDSTMSAASQQTISNALRKWERISSLRFLPRTTQTDYVSFFSGEGCWSYIGRIGGKQQLSLGPGCVNQRNIMHEVGHAIGLWHEQSRQDRDNFVIVDLCYVESTEAESNFNKEISNAVGPYDYASLMHYSSGEFRSNLRTDKPECAGKPTTGWPLLRVDGTQIQPGSVPTATDTAGVASLYASTSRNDFDHDGKRDIAWHNDITGETQIWALNGVQRTSATVVTPDLSAIANAAQGWYAVGTADFNADGDTDILWHNDITGDTHVWPMRGTQRLDGISIAPELNSELTAASGWQVVGTGDFNADAKTDILWLNRNTGNVHVWVMNGLQRVDGVNVAPELSAQLVESSGWRVGGTGDFNLDGKIDILWHNLNTGTVHVWLMNDLQRVAGVDVTPDLSAELTAASGWRIVGAGDFNDDGSTDILWHNETSGDTHVWHMNGTVRLEGVSVYDPSFPNLKNDVTAASGWRVIRSGN